MRGQNSFSEEYFFDSIFSPEERVSAVANALLSEGCNEGQIAYVLDSERTGSEIISDLYDDVWDDFVEDLEYPDKIKEFTIVDMVALYVIARAYRLNRANKYRAVLDKIRPL